MELLAELADEPVATTLRDAPEAQSEVVALTIAEREHSSAGLDEDGDREELAVLRSSPLCASTSGGCARGSCSQAHVWVIA